MGGPGGSSAAPRGGGSCRCRWLNGHGQYWTGTGRRALLGAGAAVCLAREAGEEPRSPGSPGLAAAPLPLPRRVLCLSFLVC